MRVVIVALCTGHEHTDNALGPGNQATAIVRQILHIFRGFGSDGQPASPSCIAPGGLDNHCIIRSTVSGAKSPPYVRIKRCTRRAASLWKDAWRLARANPSPAPPLGTDEHVNSSVKRCRLVKDRIRLWKQGMRDLVMDLCCARHNFQVRLTLDVHFVSPMPVGAGLVPAQPRATTRVAPTVDWRCIYETDI